MDVSCVNKHTPGPCCPRLSVLFSCCLQGLPDAAEHFIGVDQDNVILKGIRFYFLSCSLVRGLAGMNAKAIVLGRAKISQLEKPIIGIPHLALSIPPLRVMESLFNFNAGFAGVMVRAFPGAPGGDERDRMVQALRQPFHRSKIRDRIRSRRKTRAPRA